MNAKQMRMDRQLTQSEAARMMGISKTTLSRLERGLQELQAVYRVKFHKLYGAIPKEVEPEPFWKGKTAELDEILRKASKSYRICRKLERCADAEIMQDFPRRANLPIRIIQSEQGIQEFAKEDARKIRKAIRMPESPLPDLEYLIQENYKIQITTGHMPKDILGVCPDRQKQGVSMVLAEGLHATLRLETLARLLGMSIANPSTIWILRESDIPDHPAKTYAQAFAEEILIPPVFLTQNRNDFPDLYHVSLEFLRSRLKSLEYADFPMQRARNPRYEDHLPHCPRIRKLSACLHKPGEDDYMLSEGQMCKILDMDRIGFRRMIDEQV